MAMTNKEKDAAYRERMYDRGLKQMRIWVPKKSDGRFVKVFVKLEDIVKNWSKAKRARFLEELVVFIKKRLKEEY